MELFLQIMHTVCDVQEADRMTCEGAKVCHRCPAKVGDFLSDVRFNIKSIKSKRTAIERAASGVDLPDCIRGATADKVVDWDEDGLEHRAGPNSVHYENARQRCGSHLLFNAFWNVPHFCVHQMLMRDSMHAVDLGIIVTTIRAILRAFSECVEVRIPKMEGRAAAKLEARLKMILSRRMARDGQR